MQILIVNEAERHSIGLYTKLKRSANNIPVYQDKVESPRNTTIWSLLNGGKDDFFIYDRCGRLAYYVPYPISFLYRPYAQAAILSTYFGEPCGPCPTTAPTVVDSNCNVTQSNCTFNGTNCVNSDSNCTISSNKSTDIVLNATTLTFYANQTISTTIRPTLSTNTSEVTPRRQNTKFNRVIKQLKQKFQQNERPKNSSSNGHGQSSHHQKYGFRFSHRSSQITTVPTTTSAPPTTTHRIRHYHHHQGHHKNRQAPTTTQSLTSTISPTTTNDHVSHKGHKHIKGHGVDGHGKNKHHFHHSNSSHVNSSFAETNMSINSVNLFLNRSEILTSDQFYDKFYPDYEMILNLALVDWLNKSLPIKSSSSTKSLPVTTTPTTTTPSLAKQSHLTNLLESLKRIKQRQRSELVH